MRIAEMNWMQVEARAKVDDRAVLPIGSVEQHAYLSLAVDAILSERVAVEAAGDSGIPVFPVQAYGFTPNFVDYPGSVTLRLSTYIALITDLLDGIVRSGFRGSPSSTGMAGMARPMARAGMARPQSRLPGALAQLVERTRHLRKSAGNGSGGQPRLVDGEFPVDAPCRRAMPTTRSR